MRLQQGRAQFRRQAEELRELLGEDVVLVDVVPGAGVQLLVLVARRRQRAEAAFGDEAELVVVVEDRAARAEMLLRARSLIAWP